MLYNNFAYKSCVRGCFKKKKKKKKRDKLGEFRLEITILAMWILPAFFLCQTGLFRLC